MNKSTARLLPLFFLPLCLAAVGACKAKKSSKESPPEKAAATEGQASENENRLVGTAQSVLQQLVEFESKADVTCWTSFRQLDWFISESSYGEAATLAKVKAGKELVRTVWLRASEAAKGDLVSKEEIDAAAKLPEVALGEKLDAKLGSFANDIGMKNFNDYQKTAEHMRLLLAVVQDEILLSGFQSPLKPLSEEAISALLDSATTLSLMLLKSSGQFAADNKHPKVLESDVAAAYAQIAEATGLVSTPRIRKHLSPEDVASHLYPLTKQLIQGKAKALKSFNQGTEETLADLNLVAEVPLSAEALDFFRKELQSFAHFIVAGYEPMRADNFLQDGSFAEGKLARQSYLDEVRVQNAIMQLYPHSTLPNGDVVLQYAPNTGRILQQEVEGIEVRLLDHQMNGVRDSAIHWDILATIYGERAFAIDPFAAEYLSEVLSIMLTERLVRASELAKAEGAAAISLDIARKVRRANHVMVMPGKEDTEWTEEELAAKQQAVSGYAARGFEAAKGNAGLPSSLPGETGGPALRFDLQKIMGGGIAVGDVNGDGYDDLFLTGPRLGRLYINVGKGKGPRFADKTEEWKVPAQIHDGHGTLFLDFDGDGKQDLLVLRSKNPSLLLHNTGNGFEDVSSSVGFRPHDGAHVAHAFDYDQDGDLDIFVGYYGSAEAHASKGQKRSLPSMSGTNGSPNQLWRNDGSTFVEVAADAGLADTGWALAAASFDFDGDKLLDLYVANDFGANRMFRNVGGGRFVDVSLATGTGDRGSGMNVDATDTNGDGRWDLYVTNIDMFSKNIKVIFPRDESTIDINASLTQAFQYLSGNKFYVSQEGGGFASEEAERFEPGDRGWAWDACFADYDNDGDDDMYLTNGWIDGSYAGNQKNQFFVNEGGKYYLLDDSRPEAFADNSRSAATFDIDMDGDLDIVVNNYEKAPRVLINKNLAKGQHWIRVALKGKGKNPHALGAQLRFRSESWSAMRQHGGGRGYLSQGPSTVHLGLGSHESADLEIVWPDGSVSKHPELGADQLHEIAQP